MSTSASHNKLGDILPRMNAQRYQPLVFHTHLADHDVGERLGAGIADIGVGKLRHVVDTAASSADEGEAGRV